MKKSYVFVFFCVVLAIMSAASGASQQPGDRAEIDAAYTKGQALRKQGKHAEAIPLLEKAATLAPKVLGPDDLATASILHTLGDSYRKAGRLRDAEPPFRRVLEIREARLGKDDFKVALALNNLAILYQELARYKEAETAQRRSLQIYEAKLPADHRDLALPMHNLGALLFDLARYEEAEVLFQRSLQIREANKEAGDVGAALTANTVGIMYWRQNRFADAEAFLRRGLKIYQTKRGPESLEAADSLNSLGLLCKALANHREAESLYRRSLAIQESKLGKDHLVVAQSLNNLAALYRDTGRLRQAEDLYRRSLKIVEARRGNDSLDAALVLANLADLYGEMGRLQEAKGLLHRLHATREAKLPKDHPAIANDLNSLGALYDRLGQQDKAESLLRRSLQITEAREGKDSLDVCPSLNNLARIFERTNRLQEADLLYRRCMQITEARLGKNHPKLFPFLHNLSETSWRLKRFQESEDHAQRCLQIAEANFDRNHPVRATSFGRLALIHHARKTDEPLKEQAQCLAILRTHLHDTFAFGSETAMLNHLDNIKGALPTMIDLAVHSDRPGAATLAYDWTLRFKGTALDTLCRYRQAQHLVAPDDALGQRVARYRTLKQLQANAALTPPTGIKPEQFKEQLARWRAETEEVEVELNRAFARKYPNLGDSDALLTAAAVQARLPADAALIEFVRVSVIDFQTLRLNGYHYRAFVLTPGQTPSRLIDLGPAKVIDDGVRAVRQQIIDFQEKLRECESPEEARTLEKNREKQFHKVSAELHARLLAPLWKAIGPAKLLYVAADGELNRLPFEALVDADGKYLAETVRCAYLSSGRDLLRKPAKSARGTVVFAGPDFKADAEQRIAQADKLLGKTTTLAARGSSAPQLRSKGWGPLPGAAAEAKDIHGLLHDSPFGPVKAYTGAAALEEVLKAMPAPRVLHLATHGFFLDQEPPTPDGEADDVGAGAGWARGRLKQADNPLLRSGIVLAGANTIGEQETAAAPVEDGWVTAEEIALLNLQGTELVVLSACQTGLGDIKTGEGVYGLRRAFLYAGARTLVTSLFEVPDTETRELMNRFYGGLKKGQGKLASLHTAQVEMLRGRRAAQGSAHPFFWASFVLVGDPD